MRLIKNIECPNCGYGSSNISNYRKEIYEINKNDGKKEVVCSCCKELFEIEEYFKCYMKNLEDTIFASEIIADDSTNVGFKNIEVGKGYRIKLNKEMKEIVNINVSSDQNIMVCIDYDKQIINNTINELSLLTSEIEGGLKCGEKARVNILVQGITGKFEYPIWFEFLMESIHLIKNNRYKLALLSIEVAFESFIDSIIYECLKNKGINEECCGQFIENINNMQKKIYKILKSLDKINFKKMEEHNKWEKINGLRNKIAHGSKVEINKKEVIEYYKFIIDSIFFINRESSVDMIYI